jgi:hypothetical protein
MSRQAAEFGEFFARATSLDAKPFPLFTGTMKVDVLVLET